MVWRLERKLLSRIVQEHFPTDPPTYLDFACGTGRILGLLSPVAASSTAVDVSPSMLQVARDSVTDVEFIEADITRDDRLGSRRFDLITAFRFFPNAGEPLRQESLTAIKRHLNPDGVLIFNNHLNRSSLLQRATSVRRRMLSAPKPSTPFGMSRKEAYELITSAGMKVEREYYLAVLPLNDRHMLLPSGLVETLESILSRVGLFAPLAQNLIFVCRHAGEAIAAYQEKS